MFDIKPICTPAMIYFIISIVAIIMIGLQNWGNNQLYCVGAYSCTPSSITAIFILKIVYVFFWTWILNLICKSGYEVVSWVLVLIPFVIMFILIALIFILHYDVTKHTPTIFV